MQFCLTVGQLRKNIAHLPDDAPVYYERIEDRYFEQHGWQTESKPNHDGNDLPDSQFILASTTVGYEDPALYITAHF